MGAVYSKGESNLEIKITSKGETAFQKQKETNKKLGKRSKTKGNNYEREIAKRFGDAYNIELVRTPSSGGFQKSKSSEEFKGDVTCIEKEKDFKLGVEVKNTKSWSLPAWLKQSEEETPKDKIPVVVFHQHGTSNDYIALSFNDFLKLVPEERVVILK